MKNDFKMMPPLVKRVNVDFTASMLKELDPEAEGWNISRQAVIKTLQWALDAGEGESVIVKTGEIKQAQKAPESSIVIIISRTQVGSNDKAMLTSTSHVRFPHPWNPQKIDLTALQYSWGVPTI